MKKRGYRATAQDLVCQSLGRIAQQNKKLFTTAHLGLSCVRLLLATSDIAVKYGVYT